MSRNLIEVNAFVFFNLPVSFEIDSETLKKRYFQIQQSVHPDRLHQKLEFEKIYLSQKAMLSNKFYEILKDPLKRALHLLEMKGVFQEELIQEDSHEPDLLMEVMEKQERMTELRSLGELSSFLAEEKKRKEACLKELTKAFSSEDEKYALKMVRRLQYIQKLIKDLKVKSHALTNY